MILPYCSPAHRRMMGLGGHLRPTIFEELSMKWETPVAIDMRFGMEITMYISNR